MTQGEAVYQHLKQLPTDAIVAIVRLTHPEAMGVRTEKNKAFAGKTVEWHIVSPDWRECYSVTAFDERVAWLSALERVCMEKWPNG